MAAWSGVRSAGHGLVGLVTATWEVAGDNGLTVDVELDTADDDELTTADDDEVGALVLGDSAVLVEQPANAQISAAEVRATERRLVMDLATPPQIVR